MTAEGPNGQRVVLRHYPEGALRPTDFAIEDFARPIPNAGEFLVRTDFVSVDPARDTPAQLARYVGYFSKEFVAATGSDNELTRLTHALGLVYSHEKGADGSDVVDHSAAAIIIDPRGNEVGLLRPPFEPAKIAADLTMLAASR